MRLAVLFAVVALSQARSIDTGFDNDNRIDVTPYIGEDALSMKVPYGRGDIIIERVPYINHDVIIEKVPYINRDVIIEKIPYSASEVLNDVLAQLKEKYEKLRVGITDELYKKLVDLREACAMEMLIAAIYVDDLKDSEEYQRANAKVREIRQELEKMIKSRFGWAKKKIDEFLGGERMHEFEEVMRKLQHGIKKGVVEATKVVKGIKGWIWDAIDEYLEPKRQMDFEFDFGIERFFKNQYKKLTDFVKKIFDRDDVKNANEYVRMKIQEAIAVAKEKKENFDIEKFKADVKSQVENAIEKVKSFGRKIDVAKIKSIVKESVDSIVLAARTIKSDFEASQLKKDLEQSIDDAGNYFNRFLSKYTDVEDLERQLAVLKQTLKEHAHVAIDEIRAHESDLKQIRDTVIEKVTESLNAVRNQVRSIDLEQVRESVIDRVNEVIEKVKTIDSQTFRDEYDKAKQAAKEAGVRIENGLKDMAAKIGLTKRELKSFQQMNAGERAQWNAVLAELRTVLRQKFGQQDPEEDYRLSPEAREKLAAARKELLNAIGQTGHEDLTDDEWKRKWGEVVTELENSFANRERRELKGYNEMTEEEREQHEALLVELRQKLLEKFGVQDENEGLRPSMETRQKLKQVLKSIRKDQEYEDLTDPDWRGKYQKVIDELESKFRGA